MTQTARKSESASSASPEPESPKSAQLRRMAEKVDVNVGPLLVKILLLAVFDALGVFAIFASVGASNWLFVGIISLVVLAFNWIYLRPGANPSKYFAPGLLFLLIFQVFVIGYTGYISFTNFGSGHSLSKANAIDAIIAQNQQRVEGSDALPVKIVEDGGTLGFLATKDGKAMLGTAEDPLHPIENATWEGGQATGAEGWKTLTFQEILGLQAELANLTVPVSDDTSEGTLRTTDGSNAFLFSPVVTYDAASDTMTNTQTGVVYADNSRGSFAAEDGSTIKPGWISTIGFSNYTKAFTDSNIRGPIVSVLIWTFVFAFLTVALTFLVGLFLALVFNKQHMKGRKIYRTILIVPYAFPAFLGALVWSGMFNETYGFINEVLLGGASIPWLTDPWLARFVVLFVNLWLGFPYMFLVTTGALQSIPEEVDEASSVDGASAWQTFRLIKLPLLLVSVAPLLIASFAFNFNNFNVIYMTTGGGPKFPGGGVSNIGSTDILISMVYKIAFDGQVRDYGLASVLAILIFFIVTIVTIISFRQTKALEEIN